MGSIVFFINIEHGFLPAFGSFLKQLLFNLFMAGYNTRTCEKLAKSISNKLIGLVAASIIPTLQAFLILYAIHYFGATPKPIESTYWQAIGNVFFFLIMALMYRKIFTINSLWIYKMSKFFRLRIISPARKLSGRVTGKKLAS
jgi:hypothetical protein